MGWLVETKLFQGMEAIRPRSRRLRLYEPVCHKLKRDAISGKVSRFKARLIVQGFKMQQDVNYNDTFSPTPGSTATRTIISIATAENLELHSVDFTQAFIQADRLPEGVNGRFFISPPQALQTLTPLV